MSIIQPANIAQLKVPSDAYGTPNFPIVDWAHGLVYLIQQAPATIRSYYTQLETQEPILSAFLNASNDGGWALCGDADPVTGNLVIQANPAGLVNGSPINRYNPSTLVQTGTYGASVVSPFYPSAVWVGQQIVCVGCGTLASGGETQVGYALLKESELSGYVAVIRTDTMTHSGAYLNVIGAPAVDNRGIMCRGKSGASGATVFLTCQGTVTGPEPSYPIYKITISPGAETYDPGTWPATNPYITSVQIGSLSAASVDPTWTDLEVLAIGYDQSDGNLLLDVIAGGSPVITHYLVKLNAETLAVIWRLSMAAFGSHQPLDSLQTYSVSGHMAVLSNALYLDADTATGAASSNATAGLSSLNFTSGDDALGLIFSELVYAQTVGGPSPVDGTPASFTGWAILSGVRSLSTSFSAADIFFSPTSGFYDLTKQANRRRFFSASGGAVSIGNDGSSALGTPPSVFLHVSGGGLAGTADTFADNAGTGGSFAVAAGPLALASSAPPGSQAVRPAGPNVVGDYRNGNLYVFNLDQPLDNGTQRRWLRRWRALSKPDPMPHRFVRLTIQMETGAQVPDGTAPTIELRWSDDGGHTWSNRMIAQAGPTGKTAQRVFFTPLGSTKRASGLDRIFELSSSDPFKVAIISAELEP